MSTPEGKVKDMIKKILAKYKIYPASKAGAFPKDANGWYYMPVSASAFGVAGIPDFIGHYKGIFWSIEAKAKGKKPTGFQALQLKAIALSGGEAFIVDGEESMENFEHWVVNVAHAVDGSIF